MDSVGYELKDKLEKMLLHEKYDIAEVLKLSQELDKYILVYYKSVA